MGAFINIDNGKIHDNCLGKWPKITSLKTATAYKSLEFDGK